ncbi:MAG: hypothetical protein H6Q52_2154 [Deltaproteobacteria bacterium]|nr:hypothetical protein [Deltaproteobacteria bacterium]
MIIFFISIFCFCVSPINAGAENWTYFDTDKSGKWYYDKESLTGTRTGIVVFWVKIVYSKEGLQELLDEEKSKGTYKKSYDSWNYSLSNYACECDKLTCGLQGSIAYNTKGDVLNADSPSPVTEKWGKSPTGSILDKLVNEICRTKQ